MIPKTQSEKEALKKAKQLFSEAVKKDQIERVQMQNKPETPKRIIERYGLMNTERELPDDYPVYFDYLYVIDDKITSGVVIRSDIQATVLHLKRDLQKKGYDFTRVYTCDLSARGIY